MEDPKVAQPTPQTLPPPTPQTLPPQSKKRPLEQNLSNFKNSPYYKMRAVLRDLRPHFIEVLKTPNFRNCKAADEIRQGMKDMMDLYKEMMSESIKLEKCNNAPSNIEDEQNLKEHQKRAKLSENSTPETLNRPLDHQAQGGSYVVGGSAFGWNFVTFQGSKSVYYGRTKESFRAANPL
ncbi:uncharacterized protein LOC111410317 [Olea europaea var. sylvestris]|uniref:Uncharacterized protein n=1 Tax=Olea europaea subsp. europaea TaxID=158383 RepID=A0A8S0UFA2_OLEEU|nr:uncharacterized protein LOC111410317 [Olea europaea var. sylvestris]CAA3015238.1 Hypothetical predicted protein [Olea europaea subsp. europaea]